METRGHWSLTFVYHRLYWLHIPCNNILCLCEVSLNQISGIKLCIQLLVYFVLQWYVGRAHPFGSSGAPARHRRANSDLNFWVLVNDKQFSVFWLLFVLPFEYINITGTSKNKIWSSLFYQNSKLVLYLFTIMTMKYDTQSYPASRIQLPQGASQIHPRQTYSQQGIPKTNAAYRTMTTSTHTVSKICLPKRELWEKLDRCSWWPKRQEHFCATAVLFAQTLWS